MSQPHPTTELPAQVRWFAPWTWSRWKLVALICVLLSPVFYALSGGPAMWLVEHDSLKVSTARWFYGPVFRLGDLMEDSIGHGSYYDYLELWSQRGVQRLMFQQIEDTLRDDLNSSARVPDLEVHSILLDEPASDAAIPPSMPK